MDLVTHRRQQIAQSAALDAAYFTYIVSASCIAGAGLIMNSSEFIVASMMICPLMNNINAITFGVLFCDTVLFRRGLLGTFVGMTIGTIVGILAGLIFSQTLVLTDEMLVRTYVLNLKWSLVMAFFASIAAGASLLNGHTTTNMAGIAISTSVLPPLVNFGLLLPNTAMKLSNAVSLHACLVSAWIGIGNIVVIIISSATMMQIYMRIATIEMYQP
jgi:uncharacterized hydrophobic protein (TIGR00271 family)